MPERKITYEILEHTSDSGFIIRAPSWERLYIDAALALTDILVKLDCLEEKEKKTVNTQADNPESLMVKWLNEVLFLFEQYKFLSKRIIFDQFDGKKIGATLWGDNYNPTRHGHISEIKAVTYHQLELGESLTAEPQFYAKIFLDL